MTTKHLNPAIKWGTQWTQIPRGTELTIMDLILLSTAILFIFLLPG